MSDKWIPNGHIDFVTMAENFARTIAAEPERFHVQQEDLLELTSSVVRARQALQANYSGSRSKAAANDMKEARAQAVKIIRRLGNLIRGNDKIDSTAKIMLNMRPRSIKTQPIPCPQEPPRLRFLRALHEGNGAIPVHELEFTPIELFKTGKPEGAVRLELFVDLIPPEEPIPTHPGANNGGRPWYLRSYTRSPIKLTPPMARVPMRVVYWGRWAGASGDFGPYSATVTAWVEGGSHHLMAMQIDPKRRVPILEVAEALGQPDRDPSYRVAILEVQYQSLHSQEGGSQALPAMAERDTRRLEGPGVEEAA